MFIWFIRHQLKQALRSSIWQKNVATNIILGFILLLLFMDLLFVGLMIDKILNQLYPDRNPVTVFNGIILYYLLGDLVIRFFMQQLSGFSFEAYLHLPIKKSAIVHYAALKTLLSIFNILPYFVFLPFAFKVIPSVYSTGMAWTWLVSMISLTLANNFFTAWLKRQLGSKPKIVGFVALAVALLIVLDYFKVLSLSTFSGTIFDYITQHAMIVLVPVALLIASYLNYYLFLRRRLYPEELRLLKDKKVDVLSTMHYFKRLGLIGDMITLEIKLLWRNKRTKTFLMLFPIFVLYGLIFYTQPTYKDSFGFLIFVGFFMTGGMMLGYLNYTFGWESSYFDAILTNNIDFNRYLRVKYIIAQVLCTICYIVTIPYVFFGWDILLVNTALYLYNMGFLAFVLLYMATFNKKRMDLSRNSAFNYQGIGASNWLAVLPGFLLPILLALPFRLAGYPKAGFLFLGILGMAGLVFSRSIIKMILRNLEKRKYIMADGFRQKG